MASLPQIIANWSWMDFCGKDSFVVWNTKHRDLDICFQYVAFQMPILTMLTIVSAYYVGALRLTIRRCSRDMWVLRIRSFLALCLVVVPVIRAYIEETKYPGQLRSVDFTLTAIQGFSWLVHFCYLATLQHRLGSTLRGPTPIGVLWSVNYIICWMNAHTNYLIIQKPDTILYGSHLPFIFSVVEVFFQTLFLLTLLPTGRENPRLRFQPISPPLGGGDSPMFGMYSRFRNYDDRGDLGTPMESCGLWSHLFFSWVNPLLAKGISGKLETADDLFDLPVSLSAQHLSFKICRAVYPIADNYIRTSLFRALHATFWKEFYGVGVLKFIGDVASFCSPLLLNQLVRFIEDRSEPIYYGYVYAAGLCATTLIGAFCNTHFSFKMSMVSLRIRGAVVSLIYRKTLSLNQVTLSALDTGEILNYMSTDVNRITNSCNSFHSFWSVPFQVVVISYLLYLQVGIAFVGALLLIVLLIPVNRLISVLIQKYTTAMMKHKDSRLSCMTEMLKGIKAIKLNVWETFFTDRISGYRKDEMKYLAKRKYLDAVCVYLWAATPIFVNTSTFVLYLWFGNQLDATVVFTTFALLNMLIFPLNAFPWILNGLVEAWVSVKRVDKLVMLSEEELRQYYDPAPPDPNQAIEIRDGNFHWGDANFTLQSISLTVQNGQLIGVIGSVGSGKSSLLAALMAELGKSSGFFSMSDYESGFGFVSQIPWLQRGTIQDNILFGDPLIHHRYMEVIEACALIEDLNELPGKDNFNVGENGAALSGGQRARVSLARAVYKDMPVYFLDDVLSSVDAHVARHIFARCINGLLKNKTRLLVTHNHQFLVNADLVIELNDGKIVKCGQPSEVLENYNEFEINMFLEMEPAEGEEPERREREDVSSQITEAIDSDEQKLYGTIGWNVYATYFSAAGFFVWPLLILMLFLMQGAGNLNALWLARWVTNIKNNTGSPDKFMKLWAPDLLVSNSTSQNSFYLTVYVAIGGAGSVFVLFRAFLFAYGGLVAARRIHNRLLDKVMNAKIVFFDVVSVGHILNRFSSDVGTIDDSLPFVLNILLALIFAVVGTLITTIYSLPYICLIIAPLVPIYYSLQSTYRSSSCELKRLSSLTLSPLYSHFAETVEGLVTIRAFRATSKFKLDNISRLDSNTKTQLCLFAVSQWLGMRLQLIGVVLISGVGLLAVLRHHLDFIDAGYVGLAISYTLSLTGILSSLVTILTETEMEMVSVERVNHYMEELHEGLEGEDRVALCSPPFGWPTHGVVSFSKVYFRHRDRLQYVLSNVSFTTRPGERIGIVGRTGAGKSSIVAALFRLAETSAGTISIDGVDIRNIALYDLRNRMGIIPQDPFIFTGSIRANLDPKGLKSDSELWNVLTKTRLSQTVRNLGGLDNVIKNDSLSVGQNQLLCLARAVLHNAKVICIDEATSNLDQESDRLIQQTIRSSFIQCTVITIAHRVRTVIDSDRVIVMGEGKILEFDTPRALMQKANSYFCQLANEGYQ